MKTTLSQQIFTEARKKGLNPHSIINNCALIYDEGKIISGENKKNLLELIKTQF